MVYIVLAYRVKVKQSASSNWMAIHWVTFKHIHNALVAGASPFKMLSSMVLMDSLAQAQLKLSLIWKSSWVRLPVWQNWLSMRRQIQHRATMMNLRVSSRIVHLSLVSVGAIVRRIWVSRKWIRKINSSSKPLPRVSLFLSLQVIAAVRAVSSCRVEVSIPRLTRMILQRSHMLLLWAAQTSHSKVITATNQRLYGMAGF